MIKKLEKHKGLLRGSESRDGGSHKVKSDYCLLSENGSEHSDSFIDWEPQGKIPINSLL